MPDCSTNCPYASRITKLETQQEHVSSGINKIDGKLDQVIQSLGRVEVLESKHNTHAEALTRVFEQIKANKEQADLQITANKTQADATALAVADLLSQIKGMARMSIVMWTLIGGSVGVILSKIL